MRAKGNHPCFLFHKWKHHYQIEHDTFMGEKIERKVENIRECVKCGVLQEFNYDSQGGSWSYLGREEIAIFLSHMDKIGGAE